MSFMTIKALQGISPSHRAKINRKTWLLGSSIPQESGNVLESSGAILRGTSRFDHKKQKSTI
jgi:hypothetical protein